MRPPGHKFDMLEAVSWKPPKLFTWATRFSVSGGRSSLMILVDPGQEDVQLSQRLEGSRPDFQLEPERP